MSEPSRRIPRFAHKRSEAHTLIVDQIATLLRKEGVSSFKVDGNKSLCSAELHKLVPRAAQEHFWSLRTGTEYPSFDSARPLTLDQALDHYDFP